MGTHQIKWERSFVDGELRKVKIHQHGWEKEPDTPAEKKWDEMKATITDGARSRTCAAADYLWRDVGLHAETYTDKRPLTVETAVAFDEFKPMNAKAGAGVAKAYAGASANPTQAKATAGALGPNAAASAALVDGIIEARAGAYVGKAEATAGFGIEKLGAHAQAEAVSGRAHAGVPHTPLQAHAQGPAASAETGVSWDYTGANVGASLAEARAGPFAARAGFKLGAGVRNGVPEVDLGPATVPCCVM